jgi:hypothetical protein
VAGASLVLLLTFVGRSLGGVEQPERVVIDHQNVRHDTAAKASGSVTVSC